MLSERVEDRAPALAVGSRLPMSERREALASLAIVPASLAIGLSTGVRRLVGRPRSLPEVPAYRIEPGGEVLRDVAAFAVDLEREPFSPRRGFGSLDFQFTYARDMLPTVLDHSPKRANRYFACPPPFRRVTIESLDGTPLAAEVAIRDDCERPGLVVAHGVFGSSGQTLYSGMAAQAFGEWGFNTIALDLRGWGRSAALSDTPISSSWREGEDILAAARYLLNNSRTTTVGGVGYSLGGASMLNAATHELAPELLSSGIVSESGFTDARAVLQIVERKRRMRERDYIVYRIFVDGFAMKMRAHGKRGMTIPTYLEQVAAPFYGVTPEELFHHGSVVEKVADVRVPALQLHAEDDWVVPVEHATRLREAALQAGNRLVGVCIRPRGAHCAFVRVVREWRDAALRRFFGATSGIQLVRR